MTWGVVLDPPEAYTVSGRTQLDLNSGPIRVDQAGIDWGDAAIQAFMAEQGSIGAAPVDFIVPNRQISIPLAVFSDEVSGVGYDQAKRNLTAKVALLQREGGVLRRSTDERSYRNVIMGDNPIAYWPLNEKPGSQQAIDYVGNRNPGTYVGQSAIPAGQSPNLVPNPSFETNLNNWNLQGAGVTVTQVADAPLLPGNVGTTGTQCMRVTTPGTVLNEGVMTFPSPSNMLFQAGVSYTISCYMKGAVGGEKINLTTFDSSTGRNQSVLCTLTTSWVRYSYTYTPAVNEYKNSWYMRTANTVQAVTFSIDGVQVTQTPGVVPYSDTQDVNLATSGPVPPDSAATFDGLQGQVGCGQGIGYFDFAGPYTLECWFATPAGKASTIMLARFGGVAGYYLRGPNASNQIQWNQGGASQNTLTSVANAALTNGTWHHIVCTYDSATMRMYIDGALNSSLATTVNPTGATGGQSFWIGGYNVQQFFPGSMAHVAVYNYGLSAAQVADHYNEAGTFPSVYADIVDAALNFPDIWGETGQIEPNVRLSLTALPDFYGPEVALDAMSSGVGGDLTGTLKQNGVNAVIQGDAPARCRVLMSNTSANDQRGVLGAFRCTNYDPAMTARLAYEAEALTPSSGITSTALSGASGGNALRNSALPPNIWMPILVTDLAGTGPLTHRGSYRMIVRAYTTTSDAGSPPPYVRLVWATGSTVYQTVNDQIQLPGPASFYLLDLGQIAIQPAPIGTHFWRGTVQAFAPSGPTNRDIYIDRVWFVPIDECAWQPSAPQVIVEGVNPLSAWDNFATLGNNVALNGRVAPLGGSWATSGAAGDFTGTANTSIFRNSATPDATSGAITGRLALFSQVFTDTEVGGDFMATAFPHGPNNSNGICADVIARYVDNNNLLSCGYAYFYGIPWLWMIVWIGGVATVIGSVQIVELPGTWITLDLKVSTSGQATCSVSLQGQSQSPIWTASGQHAALATGGSLASGKCGIMDGNQVNGASTRYYDNVFARTGAATAPPRDAVLYASRSAELRTDGMFRLDSAGVVGSPISRRQGDFPRLPPSGLEQRPVEILSLTSRGDFISLPDSGLLDPFTAQVFYRPCWLLGQ